MTLQFLLWFLQYHNIPKPRVKFVKDHSQHAVAIQRFRRDGTDHWNTLQIYCNKNETHLKMPSAICRQRVNVNLCLSPAHDDVIKSKHFPRYWPFVRGIHRSPVNSPHKDQWRGALMFSLICARINNREAGDLRRHRTHCHVIVMWFACKVFGTWCVF